MPIFWRCPKCRSLVSLKKDLCQKCNSRQAKNVRTYVVQVCYKKKRKSATASSLTQARNLEVRLKSELIEEKFFPEKKHSEEKVLSFQEFCENYLFPYQENQLKGFHKTRAYWYKWIFTEIGSKKINEITLLDIEGIKTKILQAGRAPRTAQQIVALIKTAFNYAKKWNFYSGNNPASGVKIPRFDNRRIRFLTKEEAQKLLEECKKRNTPRNHIYPITLLALTTGMRAGEIFSLKVQDINFKQGIIHVRDTKSGENAVVFIPEQVKDVLKEMVKGKKPYEKIFLKPDGKPFTEVPDVWKNIIKDLKFNEGITDPREKVVFHTLRHTFCSWLALEGIPLHIIKELARHKTIQMTERYAHLMPDTKRKAAEKIWKKIFEY